ncbi:hypothetical protein FB451DRAFT_1183983 [Mycena latifolia]|nr:hypothetical protein FB451DRAFT_1183983 [Mycena latifolia]
MISTARPKPKGPLDDPAHHIGAALAPPSPTPPALVPAHVPHNSHNSMPSVKGGKPTMLAAGVKAEDVSPWLRWAVSPHSALALLMAPPLLAIPTSFLLPFLPEAVRPCESLHGVLPPLPPRPIPPPSLVRSAGDDSPGVHRDDAALPQGPRGLLRCVFLYKRRFRGSPARCRTPVLAHVPPHLPYPSLREASAVRGAWVCCGVERFGAGYPLGALISARTLGRAPPRDASSRRRCSVFPTLPRRCTRGGYVFSFPSASEASRSCYSFAVPRAAYSSCCRCDHTRRLSLRGDRAIPHLQTGATVPADSQLSSLWLIQQSDRELLACLASWRFS